MFVILRCDMIIILIASWCGLQSPHFLRTINRGLQCLFTPLVTVLNSLVLLLRWGVPILAEQSPSIRLLAKPSFGLPSDWWFLLVAWLGRLLQAQGTHISVQIPRLSYCSVGLFPLVLLLLKHVGVVLPGKFEITAVHDWRFLSKGVLAFSVWAMLRRFPTDVICARRDLLSLDQLSHICNTHAFVQVIQHNYKFEHSSRH